jgi:hypothetical protein
MATPGKAKPAEDKKTSTDTETKKREKAEDTGADPEGSTQSGPTPPSDSTLDGDGGAA